MFHVTAFAESRVPTAAFSPIAAVREEMFFTSGDDFRVPTALSNIVGVLAHINDAAATRARLTSPSLRILANLDIEPVVLAAVLGSPPEILWHPSNPIALAPDETLNAEAEGGGAIAVIHGAGVWLADGPQQPVTGAMFTVRATAAVAQSATAWVNGNLAFATSLPAGRYQIVGMRARSTDGVLARLVFPEQVARPGVPVLNAIGDLDPWVFRYGRFGLFGEFPHTNPPTVDVLGGVAAAQQFLFDLIRVR